MNDERIAFPGPGCIVECMQGNKPVVHWVLEAQNGSVRLLSELRKESKLSASRLLPWFGPRCDGERSREEIVKILAERHAERETLTESVNILEIWDLAQGEVPKASAAWLAELAWETPTADQVAAMGRAALACKTHFKFSPPDFEIYDADTVARRTVEQEAAREREALASAGSEFFRALWAFHSRARGPLEDSEAPSGELAESLERMLRERIADPETQNDADTWKLLTKSLPEEPHMPLHLATAWGLVKEHHNFWLDRAGYEPGQQWADQYREELDALAKAVADAEEGERETASGPGGRPFISIDPASTADVDDAFSVLKNEDDTFSLSLAFACPGRFWPFWSGLDKAVLRRASSLYLPETDHHMLPRDTVHSLFSLLQNERRPATVLDITLSAEGEILSFTPRLSWVVLAANLSLPGAQAVLDGPEATVEVTARQIMAAAPYAAMMRDALLVAEKLQERRIAAGAVITERPDAEICVEHDEDGVCHVTVRHAPETPSAQNLVGELMILANSALATWAVERDISLIFRTQDVALPKEFAGVWTAPEDIARIVKHLPPSDLELVPRPHAGLGEPIYAPLTSPIRRYADLLNTGQVTEFIMRGRPRLTRDDLAGLLPQISAFSDTVGQIQRFRPRYWKLQFYKQMGDRIWWDAVVTEENDAFAVLSLPLTQITVRARRKTMGEKVYPGQKVKVRLGKVDPLRNEIRVMAVTE